ncbi:MAG TPA: cytidine deaminase [Euzebyales bacterium]|nr:cytidine deaminase [Euzebyales bacterium]
MTVVRSLASLAPDERALVDAARDARVRAYAPYSDFQVGAALRTANGRTIVGANVENASYPVTICAERVAMSHAVVQGERAFTHIAVMGSSEQICTPCGMCRQFMFEFAPDLVVLAAGARGSVARYVLSTDLLPGGFGSAALGGT